MASHRRLKKRFACRRGAMAVEMALVLPVLLLIVIGLCVAQLGAFRYHQIAALAHEGARWASVRGQEYAEQSGERMACREDLIEQIIRRRAAALDLKRLDVELQWNANHSLVTVTVRYQWIPEAFFVPRTMSCTAMALATY